MSSVKNKLNVKDIESLGFYSIDNDGVLIYGVKELDDLILKGKAIPMSKTEGISYRLIFVPETSTVFIREPNKKDKILFYGKIRNKSELKKVLKKVGITFDSRQK